MSIQYKEEKDYTLVYGKTYDYRDTIKSCEGKFDKDTKGWRVPTRLIKNLKKMLEKAEKQNEDMRKSVWKEALDECKLSFVKKGTSDYDKVLQKFKELLNS